MYFSAFPSASCAEHQCPLWEDHDSAAVSEAAAPSTSPRPLFLEELLENETKYEARDHFTLSSITQSTSQSHSWMPAALWGAVEYLGLCGAGSGPSIRAGHPTLQQYCSHLRFLVALWGVQWVGRDHLANMWPSMLRSDLGWKAAIVR